MTEEPAALPDDRLRSLLKDSQATLRFLVESPEQNRDEQHAVRRLMTPDEMLEALSELSRPGARPDATGPAGTPAGPLRPGSNHRFHPEPPRSPPHVATGHSTCSSSPRIASGKSRI